MTEKGNVVEFPENICRKNPIYLIRAVRLIRAGQAQQRNSSGSIRADQARSCEPSGNNILLEETPLLQHSKDLEIIVASYYGHREIVGLLLEKGADINAAEFVHLLLEKGANINAAGGYYGSSLQAAAAGGHTEIVSILLENGADVNAAGGHYGSSLQAATNEGHTEIVRLPLEKGAMFPVPVENESSAQ
ncbi:ankyrin repeat-containing domain protein [Mycena alexandri]|uniref:Ankyrin repeat-containing domain protein n=1 Tax=Mycena alexandri TaxID=1745969 RepID=A0AAD6WUI3_9AGAR|nr:ankyrin repeat-containing domain protein [Mycena alexandri]